MAVARSPGPTPVFMVASQCTAQAVLHPRTIETQPTVLEENFVAIVLSSS